jgi:hypothetical protein
MRKLILGLTVSITAIVALVAATGVMAGNPHQVQACTVTESGNTLTVSCKEAGLGDETQVTILITAEALCINPGGKHPKAVNKESISDESQQPVQNGKVDFTQVVTATFTPDCTPPMTVDFTNVTVTDLTNNIQLYP